MDRPYWIRLSALVISAEPCIAKLDFHHSPKTIASEVVVVNPLFECRSIISDITKYRKFYTIIFQFQSRRVQDGKFGSFRKIKPPDEPGAGWL